MPPRAGSAEPATKPAPADAPEIPPPPRVDSCPSVAATDPATRDVVSGTTPPEDTPGTSAPVAGLSTSGPCALSVGSTARTPALGLSTLDSPVSVCSLRGGEPVPDSPRVSSPSETSEPPGPDDPAPGTGAGCCTDAPALPAPAPPASAWPDPAAGPCIGGAPARKPPAATPPSAAGERARPSLSLSLSTPDDPVSVRKSPAAAPPAETGVPPWLTEPNPGTDSGPDGEDGEDGAECPAGPSTPSTSDGAGPVSPVAWL